MHLSDLSGRHPCMLIWEHLWQLWKGKLCFTCEFAFRESLFILVSKVCILIGGNPWQLSRGLLYQMVSWYRLCEFISGPLPTIPGYDIAYPQWSFTIQTTLWYLGGIIATPGCHGYHYTKVWTGQSGGRDTGFWDTLFASVSTYVLIDGDAMAVYRYACIQDITHGTYYLTYNI